MLAYDQTMYNDMESWSVRRLIQRIRDRDQDVDKLHADNSDLKNNVRRLQDKIADLEDEIQYLKQLQGPVRPRIATSGGPVSMEAVEEAEADEFAKADI